MGVRLTPEIEVFIRYHHTPAEFFRHREEYRDQLGISLSDIELLLNILITAELFKIGQNVNMRIHAGGRPAESFTQTWAFLSKFYTQAGAVREAH